jgi:hypothetical protein
MSEELKTLVILYLLASLYVACDVIISRIKFCNYMQDIPYGDWEYHSYNAPITESLKWIFIPSVALIQIHKLGIKLVNFILYRD